MDYKDPIEFKKKIIKEIKLLNDLNQNKLDLKWIKNISKSDFESLIMHIFDLTKITKSKINYEKVKEDARDVIVNHFKKELNKKERINNEWFKYIARINKLGFNIIFKSKKDGINELYLKQKDKMIICYIKGSEKSGLIESFVFFNGKPLNEKSNDILITGTELTNKEISFKYNPESIFESISKDYQIEEYWVDSNIKKFIGEDFFSDYNASTLDQEIVKKMSYYNLHNNYNIPTFKMQDSFKIKFNSAFRKLSIENIEKFKIRKEILNISNDCENFIKSSHFNYFEKNGIKHSERKYLIANIVNELNSSSKIENPFLNIIRTIKFLDKDDCIELLEKISNGKKKLYSNYKFNEDDIELIKNKLLKKRVNVYV